MPDLIIVPNRNSATGIPTIQFGGASGSGIRLEVANDGSLAFLGSQGQLFGISDSLTGSLMAVSDIAGLPIFEVFSDDRVVAGSYNSNAFVVSGLRVGVGTGSPQTTLHVTGIIRSDAGFYSGATNIVDLLASDLDITGLSGYLESRFVHRTGNEIISGEKYFNNNIYLTNNKILLRSNGDLVHGLQFVSADTVTRMFSNSPVVFSYTTDGSSYTERMRISLSDGNVGIGTSSPNKKLELGGGGAYTPAIRFSHGTAGYLADFGYKSDGNKIYLSITDGSVEKDVLVASYIGNIGIGTTSPTAQLHVASGTNSFRVTTNNVGSTPQATITNGTQTAYYGIDGDLVPCIYSFGNHAFRIGTNNTPRIYVLAGGEVGVGTASPSTFFHATGVVRTDAAYLSGATNIADIFATKTQLTTTGQTLVSMIGGLSGVAEGNFVHRTGNEFISGDKTFLNAYTRISGGGALYVMAPAYFHGADGSNFVLSVQKDASLNGKTDVFHFRQGSSTAGAIVFSYYGWSGHSTIFDSNGNFGIGINPMEKLHASGAIRSELGYFSGATNIADIFATKTQLTTTGQTLINLIGGLSGITEGNFVHRTGAESISGNKSFVQGGDVSVGTPSTYPIIINASNGTNALTLGSDSSKSYIQSWNSRELHLNNQGNSIVTNVGGGTFSVGGAVGPAKLNVSGTSTRLLDLQSNGSDAEISFFSFGGATDNRRFGLYSSGPTFIIRALNDSYSSATNAMLINRSSSTISNVIFPNGNVGIGTTSPGHLLDVSGTVRLGVSGLGHTTFVSQGVSVNYREESRVYLAENQSVFGPSVGGTNCAGIRIMDSNNANYAYISTSNKALLLNAHGDGNVGIGTKSPNHKLIVSGGRVGIYGAGNSNSSTTYGLVVSPTGDVAVDNFWVRDDGTAYVRGHTSLGRATSAQRILNVQGSGGNSAMIAFNHSSNQVPYVGIGYDQNVDGMILGFNDSASDINVTGVFISRGTRPSIGISTLTPRTPLHVYASNAEATTGRYNYLDVLTLESENTASVEYDGFGQGIVFRGSTYINNTQRTIGRIVHKINDSSTNVRGSSFHFETLSNCADATPTEKMVINFTGNVGIGTTNPTAKLHVNELGGTNYRTALQLTAGNDLNGSNANQILLSYHGANNYSHAIKSRHNSAAAAGNAIDFYLWQYGADVAAATGTKHVMTLDGNGNVGIGVNNPTVKLEIAGVNGYPASAGSTDSGHLQLRQSGSSHMLNIGVADASPWGAWLQAQDTNSLGTNYPLLLNPNGGNVGIGIKTPSHNLSVVGASTTASLSVAAGPTTYSGYQVKMTAQAADEGFYMDVGGTKIISAYGFNDADEVGFGSRSYENTLYLKNGNVGIGMGIAGPTSKLHVTGGNILIHGSNGGEGLIYRSAIGAGNKMGTYYQNAAGTELWRIVHDQNANNTNDIQFASQVNNVNLLTLTYGGNVGIGTVSPSQKLHVTGSSVFAVDGGSVGIGTASPDTRLEVSTATVDAHTNILKLTQPSWSSAVNKNKNIVWDDSTNITAGIGANFDGGKVNLDFHSLYDAGYKSDSNVVMRLQGNGLVGIGTTSPSQHLHVTGSTALATNGNGVTIGGSSAPSAGKLQVIGSSAVAADNAAILITDSNAGGGSHYISRRSDGLNFAEYSVADGVLFLKEGPLIGMGTLSPTKFLHVTGGAVIGSAGGNLGVGTVSTNYNLQTTGVIGFDAPGGSYRRAITPSYMGYSSTWKAMMIGSESRTYNVDDGSVTISFNYNPSGNRGGSFNGNGSEIIFRTGTSFYVPCHTGNGLFDNYYTNLLHLGKEGRIGIGTDAPAATLHVTGATLLTVVGGNVGINGQTSPQFPLSIGNASLGNKIALYDDGGTVQYGFGIQASLLQMFSDGISDDITFGYGNSASMTRNVTFKGNGPVGIGTISPSTFFHTTGRTTIGSSSSTNYYLQVGNDSNTSVPAIRIGNVDYGTNGLMSVAPGKIEFDAPGIAGGRMSILGNGTVGIGVATPSAFFHVTGATLLATTSGDVGIRTTNPSMRLHVVNTTPGDGNGGTLLLDRTTAASHETALNWGTAGTKKWFFGLDNDGTDNLLLYNWQTSTSLVKYMVASNYIGIGTTSPSAFVHVTGTTILAGNGGNVGIGATSPNVNTKLNVVGGISSEKSVGGYYTDLNWSGNNPYLSFYGQYFDIGYATNIGTAPAPSLRIHNNGIVNATGLTLIGNQTVGKLGVGSTTSMNYNGIEVRNGNFVKHSTFGYDGQWDNIIRYAANGDPYASSSGRFHSMDGTITAGSPNGNLIRFNLWTGNGTNEGQRTILTLAGDGAVTYNGHLLSGTTNVADIFYPRQNPSGYAPSTSLTNVVYLTGTQIVTGEKRFANSVLIMSGAILGFGVPASGGGSENSDDLYLYRENTASDTVNLKLVLGDDGGAGDSFKIGYRYYATNAFTPIYDFPLNGAATISNNRILTSVDSGAINTNISNFYVDRSNTQDITGAKSFINNVSTSGDFRVNSLYRVQWTNSDHNYLGAIGTTMVLSAQNALLLEANNVNTTGLMQSTMGYILPSIQVTSNTSLSLTSPDLIYCNNATPITITFPSVSTCSGRAFTIKSQNVGSIYLTGAAGTLFDGQPSYMMTTPYRAQKVHCDGSNYYLI